MFCGHNVGMEIFDPYELILCECSSGHSELLGVHNGGMETFYLYVLNLCAFEDSLSLYLHLYRVDILLVWATSL